MKTGSIGAIVLAAIVGIISPFASSAQRQTAEVRVLASNGVKAVIESVLPQAERTVGHPLAVQFDTSEALKGKIEAGDAFDVVILTSEVVGDLIKAGKLTGDSRAEICRAGIGIGIRAGAPKPGIGTPEALKRTLLDAKSITYAEDGASRPYVEKMIESLGIARDVKSKIVLQQGSARTTASVANGQAEFVITLSSEILPVRGIELLGPLPSEFQHYVGFAAGIGAQSKNEEAAGKLIGFLASPAVAPVFKAKGMETP